MEKLRFILTKEGFRADDVVYAEKDPVKWFEKFTKSPYETLYELSFRERPDCFDAAGIFLFQIAEQFTAELTAVSGL